MSGTDASAAPVATPSPSLPSAPPTPSAKYVLIGWLLGPATLFAAPIARVLCVCRKLSDPACGLDPAMVETAAWYAHGLGLLVTAACFAHPPSRRCPEFWVLVAYQPACALFWWGLLTQQLWPPYEIAIFLLLVSFAIAIPCLALERWLADLVSAAVRPR
jgi:hypothetical protein